jgi:hypothetical protein
MGVQALFVVEYPCGKAIALPPQSQLGIFRPPQPRPNLNKWPANFVCHDCGQWSSHSAEAIRLEENASLVHSLAGESFWRVEFACDQKGCEQCISTHIVWPESATANFVAAFVRASSGLRCPEHGLILQPQEPVVVQRSPYHFRS